MNEEKLRKYAFPPACDTRVLVCGLPGVYDKLCGPRDSTTLSPDSYLFQLGYSVEMVVKL